MRLLIAAAAAGNAVLLTPARLIPPEAEYKEVVNDMASMVAASMEAWLVWRDSLLRFFCERYGFPQESSNNLVFCKIGVPG